MRIFSLLVVVLLSAVAVKAVEFPGPSPGDAQSAHKGDVFTLGNNVISESWTIADDGSLHPALLSNKITGQSFDQGGRDLFALATKSEETKSTGIYVGVRLTNSKVLAQASGDGKSWHTIASFSRTDFAGEPRLVRIGKMNLKAESKNYAGEAGEMGSGNISEIPGHDAFAFNTNANHAATTEFPFPASSTFISCKIDRGTDQGMSWAPALAVIWDDSRKFLLIGARDSKSTFNVTTIDGEKIVTAGTTNYPAFDLASSSLKLVGTPVLSKIELINGTARAADHLPGMQLSADLVSNLGVHVHWIAQLHDGTNYIHQAISLASPQKALPLFGVEMVNIALPQAETIGSCPGSPVAGSGMFVGCEMPGSQNAVDDSGARIGFSCKLQLSPEQSYEFGSVIGVAATNQLRRSFLCYIEDERARKSSPFLHYNDWYDLGTSVTAAKLLDAAKQFDTELVKKRGVPVQSYLVDDGWDNPSKALWSENQKTFPQGFAGVKSQMDAMGSHMSIWISPLGGYGGADERTQDARKMGLIPPDGKLDFSYPAYKNWFQNRCLQLMQEDGVNAFKWDKAGDGVSPHFMALLDIAEHLRKANPNLFINVTVGTWPSPFWLNHIDSTWRNGSADVGWAGKGDDREKWLTFRDGYCHRLFVEAAPLYPLNSIMHHGIVHGRVYQGVKVGKTGAHLKNEARSYFANGTSLQELYITPSMMTPEAWDQVAEAAKWAHANADVLVDSHWVGGDPLKLEPYGYAAWSPRKGTLMIRNPDDGPREISVDAQTLFDLPDGAAKSYSLTSPYKDQRMQSLQLNAGQATTVKLDPFEVLVFDAVALQ